MLQQQRPCHDPDVFYQITDITPEVSYLKHVPIDISLPTFLMLAYLPTQPSPLPHPNGKILG